MRMEYDFDSIIARRGTNSYKWDTSEEEGVLPMWVADMDFPTAPVVVRAVERRAAHGIYGYTKVPDVYYEAVIGWFAGRHGWRINPDWIVYTSGVVPAVSAVIQALTEPGDRVIVQTPAYNCFFSSIRNSRCELSVNRLLYREGRYTVDYDDLETKASDPKAKLLLLCNPHNPSGRLMVNPGTLYGPGGEGFIRLNLACPRVVLAEGLRQLAGTLKLWIK